LVFAHQLLYNVSIPSLVGPWLKSVLIDLLFLLLPGFIFPDVAELLITGQIEWLWHSGLVPALRPQIQLAVARRGKQLKPIWVVYVVFRSVYREFVVHPENYSLPQFPFFLLLLFQLLQLQMAA